MDAAGLGGAGGGRPPVAGAAVPVGFLRGALALGVLEVVEWPVTLLVLAGTYVVDRARSSAADSPGAVSATVEPHASPDVVVPSATEQSDADHSGHA